MIGEILSSLADSAFSAAGTAANTILSSKQQWKYYKKQSELDWNYYKNYYAPLNQQLQQEMFDYQTAGNLKAQGDLIGVKKNALLENGYNPILAINGGVSGSVSPGGTGALSSPHSAHSFNTMSPQMKMDIFKNALEMKLANEQADSVKKHTALDLSKGAVDISKQQAEIERIKAETAARLKESEMPGVAGQMIRSLMKASDLMGDWFRENWTSARSLMSDFIHSTKPFDSHAGKTFNPESGKWTSSREDLWHSKQSINDYELNRRKNK